MTLNDFVKNRIFLVSKIVSVWKGKDIETSPPSIPRLRLEGIAGNGESSIPSHRYFANSNVDSDSDSDESEESDCAESVPALTQRSRRRQWRRESVTINGCLDQYGFICPPHDANVSKNEDRRAIRLDKLLGEWIHNTDMAFVKRNWKTLKRAFRNGLPNSVRGGFWRQVATIDNPIETPDKHQNTEHLYQRLLLPVSTDEAQIRRDITRTFPTHFLFSTQHGQQQLFNVLKAFSIFNSRTGYCQGMAFVSAVLLMYLEEHEAFWALARLAENWGMSELWNPSMTAVREAIFVFDQLLMIYAARINSHMISKDIRSSLYVTQWLVGGFLVNVDFPISLRIWDLFWWEGPTIVFNVMLSYLKQFEERLLEMDGEELHGFLRNWNRQNIDVDCLIRTALSFKLKRQIAQFKKRYKNE